MKEYLFYKQKSVTDFAEEIGVSRSYMNKIVLGKVKPSKFLAKAIENATKGEVSANEIIEKGSND